MRPDVAGSVILDDAIGVFPEPIQVLYRIGVVDAALLSEQVIAIAFVAMHVHHHSQQGGDLQGGSQATLIGSLQARPQTRDAAADLVRIGQGLRPPERSCPSSWCRFVM